MMAKGQFFIREVFQLIKYKKNKTNTKPTLEKT